MVDDSGKAGPIATQSPGRTPGGRSWAIQEFVLSKGRTPPTFGTLQTEYQALLREMTIDPQRSSEIKTTIDRIVASRSRYEEVSLRTSVPWYVISTIHNLESSLRFDCHLHNGDPLTARTVHIPVGRPPTGTPPFPWEESAADALTYDGFTSNTDWSFEKIAYLLEGYNGWGYRWYHPDVKSPYLWSFSNLYTIGKYDSDGHWNPSLVSDQIGGMILLRAMQDRGLIEQPATPLVAASTPSLAESFVRALDVSRVASLAEPGTPRFPQPPFVAILRAGAAPAPSAQGGSEQAFLVGSQIVSFNKEVTEARRSAALDSFLLAQLRASKLYPSPSTPAAALEWHAAYVNTLTNIGWVLQSGVTTNQSTGASGAALNKVLIDIVSSLLGGAAGLELAAKVIEALAKLNSTDPFITLYESRVVEQSVVDFGASMGADQGNGFLVNVVECAVELKTKHNDLAIFKWDASNASISGRRYDLSLADSVYTAVASLIHEKVAPYTKAYVAAIQL